MWLDFKTSIKKKVIHNKKKKHSTEESETKVYSFSMIEEIIISILNLDPPEETIELIKQESLEPSPEYTNCSYDPLDLMPQNDESHQPISDYSIDEEDTVDGITIQEQNQKRKCSYKGNQTVENNIKN